MSADKKTQEVPGTPDTTPRIEVEPKSSTAGAIVTVIVGLLGTIGCTGWFTMQALAVPEFRQQFEELGVALPGITLLAFRLADVWPLIALLLFASMTVGSLFLAFRSHGCMRVVALGLILFVGSLPGLITTIGVFVPLQHLQRAADESGSGPVTGGGVTGPASGSPAAGSPASGSPASGNGGAGQNDSQDQGSER